ncbi:CaiB/BaiF CoA-transferase family protein [Pseudorhodoferax sp. Leaf265]|uniref:CaiB/BaiF CoA transferase family protein n=1 Tax=Pseudorhodoferax sp. Leaf265 TaxID=1736315 RepID=UPI0006FA2BE2|nr:CaiB/BaiF CoA-transferase family protein [Pseudorhodoferax sp. Leaf265]KQP05175.1 carnitine dehydratase [Pseudorhodoferax sp. Leaf265]PZP96641.1 MAG: CoA transferase [Variovorax paradoxus]PZQ07860.1 MAG: CoA transferase [Variovorax paradoxus]
MAGPLQGLRVVEMAGIGPGPFCAMLFADMGAEVLRVERPGTRRNPHDILARGRTVLQLDLRAEGAAEQLLQTIARADVLIEGFRPGVMERLGLGPDVCLARNPRLVYGRMTGWGQHGPLAQAAGHDINYIAISGALHAIGRAGETPVPPLNYVGDFGGGAMLLAFGILAALHESKGSGQGQVIDAAMTDGAALLSSMMYGMKAAGQWNNQRGENLLDGAAHFYDTYACADGKYVAIGAIEPQFYALLRERCGIADDPAFDAQLDHARWPLLKLRMADLFRTRTRDAWCTLLEGTDACFAPVLDWDEAPAHAHNRARGTFAEAGGLVQPAPAPRFSRTPPELPPAQSPHDAAALLARWAAR